MISLQLFTKYANDPAAFRADLIVDVDGTARRFGDVQDDWQRADFLAMDPALKRCNGRSQNEATMRAYLERPRGHSKTTDLATISVWALAFASRPLRGFAYAADSDQATLLKEAIATLVRLNPWLADILVVESRRVVNKADGHPGEGGSLTIESSDVGSSYGILADILICDELTHWSGDGSLWHSLISSAAKRAGCLLCVIANAGFADSWQWNVREAARVDAAWYFSRLDGPVASWLSPARLEEQRRMLPPVAFSRLWLNTWGSSGGDALLPADIEAAFDSKLEPMSGKEPGWLFCGGVDLGLTRDCSAVVVLAVPDKGRRGKIRLADNRLWRPVLGRKIQLAEVALHILKLDERVGLEQVAFDPWQAEVLAQTLESDSGHRSRNQRRRQWTKPWMREVTPSASNLREQATLTVESFADRRFAFYPCDALKSDLLKLRCEEKSYGVRLVSPRDGSGHGDTFSAFALALLVAHDLAEKKRTVRLSPLSSPGQSPLEAAMARVEANSRYEQMIGRMGSDPTGQDTIRRIFQQVAPARFF